MATFKPRVQCGECDFVGKEGREMDTHRAKKHKKKECDECSFVAELSIVFRRHKIQKHHQKCKSCEFTTAASSALKVHEQAEHGGGVLRTSVLRTGSMEHLSKSPTTISKISSNLGKIGLKKML